jgi:hypothetical protein
VSRNKNKYKDESNWVGVVFSVIVWASFLASLLAIHSKLSDIDEHLLQTVDTIFKVQEYLSDVEV